MSRQGLGIFFLGDNVPGSEATPCGGIDVRPLHASTESSTGKAEEA